MVFSPVSLALWGMAEQSFFASLMAPFCYVGPLVVTPLVHPSITLIFLIVALAHCVSLIWREVVLQVSIYSSVDRMSWFSPDCLQSAFYCLRIPWLVPLGKTSREYSESHSVSESPVILRSAGSRPWCWSVVCGYLSRKKGLALKVVFKKVTCSEINGVSCTQHLP